MLAFRGGLWLSLSLQLCSGTSGQGSRGMLEGRVRSARDHPCAYLHLVGWCSGGPQPMMTCKMQENELVWGRTSPQASTSASSSLKSEQLVTLCVTQLHRLALKFNRLYLFFFSLYASFPGRIRESMKRDLLNPFLQLPWPLLQPEMFGVCFISAEHHP